MNDRQEENSFPLETLWLVILGLLTPSPHFSACFVERHLRAEALRCGTATVSPHTETDASLLPSWMGFGCWAQTLYRTPGSSITDPIFYTLFANADTPLQR